MRGYDKYLRQNLLKDLYFCKPGPKFNRSIHIIVVSEKKKKKNQDIQTSVKENGDWD